MGNMIIAGNGNTIPPELDVLIRDLAINKNGHKIELSVSGNNLIANGIAIAYGVVGYSKNVLIENNGSAVDYTTDNGYIYVDLTMYHNDQTEDVGNIYFSSSVLSDQTDNISIVNGTYRILVAEINGGVVTVQNYIEYPMYASYADSANIVTGTIVDGVTATTQQTSDNSTKVATTEFVRNAINASGLQWYLSTPNFTMDENVCYNRLGLVGIVFAGNYNGMSTGPVTFAYVPEQYRPSSTVTIRMQIGNNLYDGYIDSSGNVVANAGIGAPGVGSYVSFNCCYLR